ncbi:hypothetical protein LCGC14_0470600 [marine sediment metagenome]|uniref:Uncharacterized protein n=1 Tax=marine sediment metagenome TaxID=412755 RepID=A0A0F9UZ60_9ZZZZ
MIPPRKVGMRNPKQGVKAKPAATAKAKPKAKVGRGRTTKSKTGYGSMTRRK